MIEIVVELVIVASESSQESVGIFEDCLDSDLMIIQKVLGPA